MRNQHFKRAYLKTTFLNLVDRFDTNLSVRLAFSMLHFVQNFCRYGTTDDFFLISQFLPPKKSK